MKHLFYLLFILNFGIAFSQEKPIAKHVIVIGVDGLSAHGIKKVKTPVLDSLMNVGAFTLKARAVFPTLSSPNWASMIMGVNPDDHKIMDNGWRRDEQSPSYICGEDSVITHPTVFKVIRQQNADAKIIIIYQWKEFEGLVEPSVSSHMHHTRDEDFTTEASIDYILNIRPEFTFIHFDHVDKAGHGYGHRSKEYKNSIKRTDSLIGSIVASVNTTSMKDNTIFLITSDHGFWGKHHGGISRKEKLIPWILVGCGVQKGKKIKEKIYTYDTAATLAYIFSAKTPVCWKGKVVRKAFVMSTN